MDDKFDVKALKKHIRDLLKSSKADYNNDPHDQWNNGYFSALEHVIENIDKFYIKDQTPSK